MSESKNKNSKRQIIFLSGGGTGGSVSPLLAIKRELEDRGDQYDFVWIGTRKGMEKEMVSKQKNIFFKPIISGKLRRYFSWRNFLDPILVLVSFFQSFFILLKERPALVLSAGSFVSVPLVWAAWFLRIPVLIHQQDVRPGLANKLMSPFASRVTVTFEKSLNDYGKKAEWVGNPIKMNISESGQDILDIKEDEDLILVVGGGTGSVAINTLVEENVHRMTQLGQVVHITGRNKRNSFSRNGYFVFEFLEPEVLFSILKRSQVVISRAGLGFLTELSFLAKPSILIPMPGSHQEDNADEFQKKQAAIVLEQKELSGGKLVETVRKILEDKELQKKLSKNIKGVIKTGAEKKIVAIIDSLISKK